MNTERVTCTCGQGLIWRQSYKGGSGYYSLLECPAHTGVHDGHLSREPVEADYGRWLGYTAEPAVAEGEGGWIVTSPEGKRYKVDLELRTCDCAYYASKGYKFHACKHISIAESKAREEKEAMNSDI